MVFGVLTVAAPASAALVCPAGYTLNGSICELVETTPATPAADYTCPATYTLVGDGDSATCDRYVDGPLEFVDATPTYTCEEPWTLDGTTCTRVVPGHYEHVNASYHSENGPRCMNPDVWTLFRDTDDVWKCGKDWVDEHTVTKDADAGAPFSCAAGWSLVDVTTRCTDPVPQCSRPTQVLQQTEPLVDRYLTCPADAEPAWTLDGDLCTRTLTVTPTDDSVNEPTGGSTPAVDACPNLEGVQWEGYDCGSGVPAAAAEPATVTAVEPATVAVPEAATVATPKPAKVVVPATIPAGVVALPSSVPAGDGSAAPTTPIYALALLALGATMLAAVAVRLVKSPTR